MPNKELSMTDELLQVLPSEPRGSIGILTHDTALLEAVQAHCARYDAVCVDLSSYNIMRLPFGGEYFDALVIDDDKTLSDKKPFASIKKSLQKNRNLIIVSHTLTEDTLNTMLSPFGFSDFCTISTEDKALIISKKWFSFAQ